MEGSGFCLCARLGALAYLASLDVGLYVLFRLRPPVLPKYELFCFINSQVSNENMIMTLRDDFPLEGVLPWDIDVSVVLEKSSPLSDPSFMVKRSHYPFVPQLLLLSRFLNTLMHLVHSGHDEGSEMFCLEYDDIIIVLLALVMIISL